MQSLNFNSDIFEFTQEDIREMGGFSPVHNPPPRVVYYSGDSTPNRTRPYMIRNLSRTRSGRRTSIPLLRNILRSKDTSFINNLYAADLYEGDQYSWVAKNGIKYIHLCGQLIAEVELLTKVLDGKRRIHVNPIAIHFPKLVDIDDLVWGHPPRIYSNNSQFYNRMRLVWRRIGVKAIRYRKDSTMVSYTFPNDVTIKTILRENQNLFLNPRSNNEKISNNTADKSRINQHS